ncbi:GNAT family N-acetyltransferase [Neptunomonas antarctica]|uniref:Acetyltransferase (GNAT) domain-containing protein n=1 Tax=Neptunomonas antarctica TaxID=619304 RepID=A0A1N7JEL2_9GAMM|nr:GNAT family N-acetyltransferase [Neptunomonas antarctica]SIS47802.1 Acetyltransferase (GNAT) domain-containing protein [Neptunomonas antarctica]
MKSKTQYADTLHMNQLKWSIYNANELNTYIYEWDNLNTLNTAVLQSDFILPLLKHFGTGKEKLAIYREGVKIKAMAIIEPVKLGCWCTFQPSQAPLGCWLQTTENSTEYLGRELRKVLPFPSLVFSITQQDSDLLPIPPQSKTLTTSHYIDTACITIHEEFSEYWMHRGKNLRNNFSKQSNKLKRNGITANLSIIENPKDIKNAVEIFGEMESAGWKSKENTAININNKQGLFYVDMLTLFANKGLAKIFQYKYNDIVVASDLCIENETSIIILKTTYNEEYSKTSPSTLMRKEEFEYIFNNTSFRRIEFYGRVMEWHTKWTNEIRDMYHITLQLPSIKKIRRIRNIFKNS